MANEIERARQLRKSRWWQNIIQNGAKCFYCGRHTPRQKITMDHVVPLRQGGTSTRGNCVPSCKECNSVKQDRTAAEWLIERSIGRLATDGVDMEND